MQSWLDITLRGLDQSDFNRDGDDDDKGNGNDQDDDDDDNGTPTGNLKRGL